MKHLKKGRKFGRRINQRRALLKGLLGNILAKGQIVTTEAKAKELKVVAERFISQSKRILAGEKAKSIHTLRRLRAQVPSTIGKSELEEIAKRFSKRKGGYVQVVRMAPRKSDSAKMALIRILED